MGQKKFKGLLPKLLEVSRTLAPCIQEYPLGVRITGAELLKEGTEKVEGEPITDPEAKYRRVNTVVRYLNHTDEMRKWVKKHGESGIIQYVQWLAIHREKMRKKYPHFKFDTPRVETATVQPEKIQIDPKLRLLAKPFTEIPQVVQTVEHETE